MVKKSLMLTLMASISFSQVHIPLTEDKPELPRHPETGMPTSPRPSPSVGNAEVPPELQAIMIEPEAIASLYNLKEGVDTTILLLKGLPVASFPKVESLKAIKFIHVHPNFQTVIMFDKEIVGATASFPTTLFNMKKNVLILQPDPSVYSGNITVVLKEPETEKTSVASIVVNKVNPYREGDGKKKDILYLFYYFADRQILSPVQVLEKYRRIYGHYPDRNVETFFLGGVAYKIIKDEVHGNVRIGDNTYRIEVVRLR